MKRPTRRIVCATDFSENACLAADVAAAIARRLRGTLVLVHVTDEAHVFGESTKDFRLAMQRAKALLRQEAERLRSGDLLLEEILLHGQSAELAVGEMLAKNPPLLVVVSSVSKTAFDRWTLGSVSEHIAQHAPVPTLVVRAPGRLLGWTQHVQTLKVVVAADFTVSSDAALAFVKVLRKIGACAVTVVHINWPPNEVRWSPGSGLALTSNPPRVRRHLLRKLRNKIDEIVGGAIEMRLEPNWGRPDAAFVHLAAEAEADLIVVGAHQRHGMKRLTNVSISRGVLRHAAMSVACVPVSVALAHGVGRHPRVERVLVASDLSASGDQAVPWAYAAVAAGGTVQLLHVVEPWVPPNPLLAGYDPKRATKTAHLRCLADARKKLAALVPA
ncbi:MAG: universal stress protein [Opitutus sp.]